ncbi:MAG: glycosyltransferase family 4 protein [Candidatus Aureabacteria bacterium]|nr:glycosyltransferase family 4 protein [Candidatus Auribacterota bacterium]
MNIVFDARMLSSLDHGIAVHAYNLLKALVRGESEFVFRVLAPKNNIIDFESGKMEIIFSGIPMYSVSEQVLLPRVIGRLRPSLYHIPSFSAPLLVNCPFVMTIHDLIHMKFSYDYSRLHRAYYKLIVKRAAQKAAKVITVSENSKRDIIDFLGLDKSKIKVIHNGLDLERVRKLAAGDPKAYVRSKFGIEGDFIICVGNPKPHKNLITAVRAFRKASSKSALPLRMLLGGAEEKFLSGHGIKPGKDIICAPDMTSKDLYNAVKGARMLVFPSMYEGFGYPPVEAMALSTPVITTNVSSLPEIVKDAALLLDPLDADAMAGAMLKLLEDDSLGRDLVQKGLKTAEQYSYEMMGRRTLSLYEELLK